jgi:cytochrome c-type biogenesis protein CcmE
MKPKHQRLAFVLFSVSFLMIAVLFTLRAFDENLVYFYSPSDVLAKPPAPLQKIRLGGLVAEGSIKKMAGANITFVVTDGVKDISVRYTGVLPSLFRESQGVIAEGAFDDAQAFIATTILAKHDENYMPKEVVDALKKSGKWREEGKKDAR